MMNRREAMVRLGMLAASGLVPSVVDAARPHIADNSASAFASSFQDVPMHYPETRIRFDKPLPDGLSGTLYRNGPALMQRDEQRYQHWFDGDGMLQSFRISGQELVHQGRLVQTKRLTAESAAGRYLWPGFGTAFPNSRAVRQPDDLNVANISVLPLDDELLALWEGGSPYRVDPATLETMGKKIFSPETEGLSFSAHPRFDTGGRIWNFGYMRGSGKLVLYELAPQGKLKRVQIIDAPNADMVHDFVITERYMAFVLTPVRYQASSSEEPQSFLQQMRWDNAAPVVVMLVDKHSLQPVHQFELDPFFAFHFGNAYEDGNSVRIDVARAPDFEKLMKAISNATLGQPTNEMKREQSIQIVLDLKSKTARTEALPLFAADFPRFDQRFTGQRTSRLFMMGEADNRPSSSFGFGDLIGFEHQSQDVRRYGYAEHVIAEEHLFVASPGGSEGVGWVLGTSFDSLERKTILSVFDSRAVDAGPICTARLPYHLPIGLHGQFVAT